MIKEALYLAGDILDMILFPVEQFVEEWIWND